MIREHYKRCDCCKRVFTENQMQRCTDVDTVRKYGENICMYCCRKCEHNISREHSQGCELLQR